MTGQKPCCFPHYFQEQFHFTKTEFLVILSNMQDQNGADLTDEAGLPVMMRSIGSSKRDYIRCWSDSTLMVLLSRLSRWCALCDLQILLGGSRSGLSRVFRFMITMVNTRYGKLVSNVKIWREYFPVFEKHLVVMGFPIDNGVLFVDGILKETCSRAVCFVWLFASVYRLCVKISDLFSLLCLLVPCGAGDGMCLST